MKINIRKLVYTALLCAIICVLSPLSFPVGPIPITLATFSIYIASSVIDWKHGTTAVLVYILLGTFGVPVFSGFTGGVSKLVGVTGGYIVGFLPLAFIVGILVDRFQNCTWIYPCAMVLGTILLYAIGTVWYIVETKTVFATALAACVVPFLPGDVIKIIIASLVAPKLRQLLQKISYKKSI